MIRYILFLACFVCAFSQLRGQEPTFVLSLQQAVKADRLVVDELGNIYLMTATSIERRNAVGNGVFRTSEMQWGDFHAIDVTDPLRPFVHFPSAGKVVFFDNTLSVQGSPIDLYEIGFDNVERMCGSRGDGYWLWDGRNSELLRVDRNFSKRYASGNLSMLLSAEIHPVAMMERGSSLFVLGDNHDLYVFDMFGAWKKTLIMPVNCALDADSDKLYIFSTEAGMQVIETNKWLTQEFKLPITGGQFSYRHGLLYSLKDSLLSVFKLLENTRN
jgi:hypothetical protein